MSTRALYTFKDEHNSWNVYKHHDGYPRGAAEIIQDAIDYFAWELPRFEADEFACAFIAAAKAQALIALAAKEKNHTDIADTLPGGRYRKFTGGGVRLMPQGNPRTVAVHNCPDIEYRYEISFKGNKLLIKALRGSWYNHEVKESALFKGTFEKFKTEAVALDSTP